MLILRENARYICDRVKRPVTHHNPRGVVRQRVQRIATSQCETWSQPDGGPRAVQIVRNGKRDRKAKQSKGTWHYHVTRPSLKGAVQSLRKRPHLRPES